MLLYIIFFIAGFVSPETQVDTNDEYFLKGKSFLESQQFDSAHYYFSKAIETNPEYDEAYFWRAFTSEELQDMEGALEDYTMAIQINEDPKYYNNRGMSYLVMERFDEAKKDFTSAIEVDPEYSKSWFNLGYLHHYKGEPEQACENITRAYELGLNFAKSYLDQYCQ